MDSRYTSSPLGDVWDIGIIGPVARERTGYPTQKPEALLERLITTCTGKDDLILDPYAGSGTALVVASRLGRRVLGIDSSRGMLRTAAAAAGDAFRLVAGDAAALPLRAASVEPPSGGGCGAPRGTWPTAVRRQFTSSTPRPGMS